MTARPNRTLPGAIALALLLACGASETPDTTAANQEATGASTVTLAITGMT